LYKIPASTLFLGKNLVFMPECHSTNSYALQLCQHSPLAPEGTVVITDNQTAGRGQRGNNWITEPGKNLTFSIILKPAFLNTKDQFFLSVFTSLSLRDYLQAKGCSSIRIKWPNDIYVGSKKICGVLIENVVSGSRFSNVVIGIGLNINQVRFGVDSATSLRLSLDQSFDLPSELETLLAFVEARYLKLRQNDPQSMMEEYLSLMYWRGETHMFSSNDKFFEGTITGLDENGRLKVLTSSGENFFAVKEISYIR
jgi:BirA family transcriptional regulator, biotin operon repressor / biotin---[acetyl-CoA-carboxylase] ligase